MSVSHLDRYFGTRHIVRKECLICDEPIYSRRKSKILRATRGLKRRNAVTCSRKCQKRYLKIGLYIRKIMREKRNGRQ